MGRKRLIPLPKELDPLARLLEHLGDRHDPHKVFDDFIEMAACSISNTCDYAQAEAREARYMDIIKRYTKLEDRMQFPKMMAELTLALDRTEEDVLGPISSALGMTNFRKGHFWTPWSVSYMMAKMLITGGPGDEKIADKVAEPRSFLTVAEPACGPGGMIMAFAQAFKEEGFNPHEQMHAQLVDVSSRCVYMAYLQCSLMGIPAVVTLGNSLSMQFTEHWYTPFHVRGNFSYRLRKQGIDEKNASWWVQQTMPERIGFLQANNLEVGQAVKERPTPALFTALEQMFAERDKPLTKETA